MPPLIQHVVNRPSLLPEIQARLMMPTVKQSGVLVASAIQGQGGIGKTVLAQILAWDEKTRQHFQDGVYWLTFGQKPDILSALSHLIQAFDATYKVSTIQAASAHLQGILSDKTTLLIVDDVWEEEHILPLLVGGKNCRFLITTRRLYVAEHVEASPFRLNVMTPDQAMELFENVLQRSLEQAEKGDALHLAQTVGFLPLALKMAAVRVKSQLITWRELTKALNQKVARLETLTGERRLLLDQPSLEASLLLSLDSLQAKYPKARELFAWLGVLPEDVMITSAMMATIWQMEAHHALEHLELFFKEALLLSASPTPLEEDSVPRYRLHDLFHDMARRMLSTASPDGLGCTHQQAHQLVLERYQAKCSKFQQAQPSWIGLPEDGYIHEQLTWHLEEAGQFAQIISLLAEETDGGQNAWYESKERLGQTAGYIQDIHRAWKLVREQSENYATRGEPIATLGLEIRLVLILTSLNSLAANLPVNLIEYLVRHGIWKPIVGLSYIRQIPNGARRSAALKLLLTYLSNEQLSESLEIAYQIEDIYFRVEALNNIASHLTGKQTSVVLQEALGITRQIENPLYRTEALSKIAPYLPEKQCLAVLQEALDYARQSKAPLFRAEAFRSIAHHLPKAQCLLVLQEALADAQQLEYGDQRGHVLASIVISLASTGYPSQALENTRLIEDTYFRSLALKCIASHLPEPQSLAILQEALENARQIDYAASRATALGSIAPHLPKSQCLLILQEALDNARLTEESDSRARSLAGIVISLATVGQTVQALEITHQIEYASSCAEALRGITPHLDPEQFSEALEIARRIKPASSRAEVLTEIAPYLPKPQCLLVLQEALEDARHIEDFSFRTRVLSASSKHLPNAQRLLVLREALEIVRQIENISSRAEALSDIAPYLNPHQLAQALHMAQQINTGYSRVQALISIAPYLPKALCLMALQTALSTTRQITHTASRVYALSDIAPHLRPNQLSEALEIAYQIEEPSYRAWALSGIAPYLPEAQRPLARQEALEIARQIEDSFSHAQTLSWIVISLTASGDIAQALEYAHQINAPYPLYQALRYIAPHLREEQFSEAFEIADQMEDTTLHAEALCDFALSLAVQGQTAQALELARQIKYVSSRALALSKIAQLLPEAQRLMVLHDALESTCDIEDVSSRVQVLRAIVPSLEEIATSHFDSCWKTLLHIVSSHTRQDMLSILTKSPVLLLERGNPQTIQEVITALRDVTRWWP